MTYEEDLQNALDTLRRGGVILYPTDTVWGIGCDATNENAVKRVYELKRRSDTKALIVLLGKAEHLWRYVEEVPEIAEQLMEVSVRPITIIYDGARNLARNVIADDGSVAIRVTGERFSRELCNKLRHPLVSTSANVSGEKSPVCFRQISDVIKDGVDYVVRYRQEDSTEAVPSIIMKVGGDSSFKIIRD